MKLFTCQACGQLLYFENTACERCHRRLGYLPSPGILSAVEPDGPAWVALAEPDPARRYRFCANWELSACNWMVDAGAPAGARCAACVHNRTIPDISDPKNHQLWQRIEEAKRRLFYALIRLNLPAPAPGEPPPGAPPGAAPDPEPLRFDFLAAPAPDSDKVMTGHDNGLITLALAEADDAERERIRTAMHEPYRTLLGHFRHEVGHYFWDRLVRDRGRLAEFRASFGDERADYAAALQRHYAEGPPPDWQSAYVSAYATVHPWEDFAETFAHYLHIVDTLEMAAAFGLNIAPPIAASVAGAPAPGFTAEIAFDPYHAPDMATLIASFLPLSFAVNSLNRTMGQPDLYPFILAPRTIAKLETVHRLVHILA